LDDWVRFLFPVFTIDGEKFMNPILIAAGLLALMLLVYLFLSLIKPEWFG